MYFYYPVEVSQSKFVFEQRKTFSKGICRGRNYSELLQKLSWVKFDVFISLSFSYQHKFDVKLRKLCLVGKLIVTSSAIDKMFEIFGPIF